MLRGPVVDDIDLSEVEDPSVYNGAYMSAVFVTGVSAEGFFYYAEDYNQVWLTPTPNCHVGYILYLDEIKTLSDTKRYIGVDSKIP